MNGPEGLSAQTFQPYLSNIQINKQNTERLKGFSGKKIAYRKRLFQAISAPASRAGNSPDLIYLRKFYAEILFDFNSSSNCLFLISLDTFSLH